MAIMAFAVLLVGIVGAVVADVMFQPTTASDDDVANLLKQNGAAPAPAAPIVAPVPAAPDETTASDQPRTVMFDSDMRVNGNAVLYPVFQVENSEIAFRGNDYRNTVLDLRNTSTAALVVAEVLSDVGCFGEGDQRNYGIGLLVDATDRRAFFDRNWIYYPGSLRAVDPDGPFATVYVVCTDKGKVVEGATIEIGGISSQTNKDGMAQLNIKNIRKQIMSVKATGPGSGKAVEKEFAAPILAASGKLDEKFNIYGVVYRALKVELEP